MASPLPHLRGRLEQSHFHSMARDGRGYTQTELLGVIGVNDIPPVKLVVDTQHWGIESMCAAGVGVQLTLSHTRGEERAITLESIWRSWLTVKGQWVTHFFEARRDADRLELQSAGAALVMGPVYVPLPKRLTPECAAFYGGAGET